MFNHSSIVELIVNLEESGSKKSYPNLKKYLGTFLDALRKLENLNFYSRPRHKNLN
jgi:hypothetical protein